jgi:solute carrier family 8 (sodium/calcium exchanger)
MERIQKMIPSYVKAVGVALTVCVAVSAFTLWYEGSSHGPEGPDRALLAKTEQCNGDVILGKYIPGEQSWDVTIRAILYLLGLGYLFLGVAISADTFMAAIEVITSQTTTVMLNGNEVEVEVWNSTVANLTLMALGSSAPEILLAVVETVSTGFQAGDLGPGTIVGSAAFNLLFITAICISSLPPLEDDESTLEIRRIEEFGVFGITAVSSLWAYFWMVVVLEWWTPSEITMEEALITFLHFPALVIVSYAQDSGWWGYMDGCPGCGDKKIAPEDGGEDTTSALGDAKSFTITGEDGRKRRATINAGGHNQAASVVEAAIGDSEDAAEAKIDPAEAAKKAAQDAMRKKKKSRLEYRIQATRKMTGGKRVLPNQKEEKQLDAIEEEVANPATIILGFEQASYKYDESVGTAKIKVVRSGVEDESVTLQFDTSDGDAVSGTDYVAASGSIEFKANETEKTIELTIIDDNEWAPDKHFYVRLFAAKSGNGTEVTMLTATTQVVILNDDDPGVISFESKTHSAIDTKDKVVLKLERSNGQDGNVLAFLRTQDGTAYAGKDYVALTDDFEVHFEDKVREMEVPITLLKNEENANCTFTVEVTSVMPEGAKIGDISMCTVIITDDKNYKELMENVVAMMDDEMGKYGVGTSTWGEQFHQAMNMGSDGDDPEFIDYLMHFLSFYWKVLHALVPPTDMYGGWPTFYVSLCFIGGITCAVGDMAKMLGCVMGLKDSVTAITFVALGTSLPDTFASMEATVSDETADAAITNVTGSNSVNVFLGLGLPWTLAAIYHQAKNSSAFPYPAGDLVFSVLVFFAFAVACVGMLLVRRFYLGAELGGNKMTCYVCSTILGTFWFAYVIISAMKTYRHI